MGRIHEIKMQGRHKEWAAMVQECQASGKRVDVWCQENGIKMTSLRERVEAAVWEAQIKFVFPKLEKFRRSLIEKYEGRLNRCLPITSSNGEKVDNVDDLEIGQLYHICRNNRFIETSEFKMLEKMREARNILAHWRCLGYQELLDMNILQ